MKPVAERSDRTGWIIFAVVLGAFVLLICAWVFFFWVAAHNRVDDVPLKPAKAASPSTVVAQPVPAGGTTEQGAQ